MLFDNLPTQLSPKARAASFTGGDRKAKADKRRAHSLHMPEVKSSHDFIGPQWPVWMVTRGKPSRDKSGRELHKKRGGSLGMQEGWRIVTEEPVHQRVGLAAMAY